MVNEGDRVGKLNIQTEKLISKRAIKSSSEIVVAVDF